MSRPVPRIAVTCAYCGSKMLRTQARLDSGRGRYCSRACGGHAAVTRGQISAYKGRHGWAGTPIHNIWMGMRDRCSNPNRHEYHHYGGRGIKVCERWQTFENFLADMGERPSAKHGVDRIDTNGDYEPGNCRWATQAEQLRNTRRTRWLIYEGKQWCAAELARHLGIKPRTLFGRLGAGWPPERWAQPPSRSIRAKRYSPNRG